MDSTILPFDPSTFAITFWFIYTFIKILFMMSGVELKIKVKKKEKMQAPSPKPSPVVENKKVPSAITHNGIQPKVDHTSILAEKDKPIIIKTNVMHKNEVNQRVDEKFLSIESKNFSTTKKEETSILVEWIIQLL